MAQWVIPVIVSIFLLGTVGLSQEADATHDSMTKGLKFEKSHPGAKVITCIDFSPITDSTPSHVIIPDIVLRDDIHENCVVPLGDNTNIEKTIYNYGTIIIDPYIVTVVNRGTIENYGSIVIRPIHTADFETEERRDAGWLGGSRMGLGFTGECDTCLTEAQQKELETLKQFKNFFNEGTIINHGLIVIEGEMVSAGEIINKRNGLIENRNYLYSSGEIINDDKPPPVPPSDITKIDLNIGFPAKIVNMKSLVVENIVDNRGDFLNYSYFYGTIRNLCGSSSLGVTVIDIECQPYLWSPADSASMPDYKVITFYWTPAEGSGFSNDGSAYNFWITPKDDLSIVFETKTSNTFFTAPSLDAGEYDYYVNAIHSDGSYSDFDRQTITLTPSSTYLGEVTVIENPMNWGSEIFIATDGSLDLSDIVIFTDDGIYRENVTEYVKPAFLGGGGIFQTEGESYLILINPDGENGISWDPVYSTITSGEELYSVKYSGDCDGIHRIEMVDSGYTCNITFTEITKSTYPSIPVTDADGDGFFEDASPLDCNDSDASIYPGATEIANDGVDQDCDGADLTTDADGDGYFTDTAPLDCNDNDASIYPGAAEILDDGIDQDCDGADLIPDADGDGITDMSDNCIDIFNPGQEDTNFDGIGDACETLIKCTCKC